MIKSCSSGRSLNDSNFVLYLIMLVSLFIEFTCRWVLMHIRGFIKEVTFFNFHFWLWGIVGDRNFNEGLE